MLGRGVAPAPDSLAFLTPGLRAADLSLANLESPLGTYRGSDAAPFPIPGDYNLCAPANRSRYLSEWGLDLLSLANNHRLDCGEAGFIETQSALAAAGVTPLLPGPQPVLRTIHGLRFAFLAFDDISSPLDPAAAVQAIRSSHATGAMVIVSIHWGNEYQGGADERQKALAGQFAAAGAVLVWGHHPHVLQPAEWLENGGGITLVLYSLGNALFDQPGLADTRRSALVRVEFDQDGIHSVHASPFVIDVTHSRVVQPDPETMEKIRDRLSLP